jgi:hypothetical protein
LYQGKPGAPDPGIASFPVAILAQQAINLFSKETKIFPGWQSGNEKFLKTCLPVQELYRSGQGVILRSSAY